MSEYLIKLSQCNDKRDFFWYSDMYMNIMQYSVNILENPAYPREKYYHMGKLFNCLINQKNTYPTKHEISKIRQGLYVPDSHFLDVSGYQSWDLERLIREFNKWQGHVDVGKQITSEEYKIDLASLNQQYSIVNDQVVTVDWYSKMNEIVDLTLCTKEILENGSKQAKRNVLSKLGSNLVWDDKNLMIYNDIAIDKLVEGIKRTKAENPKFEPKNYVVNKRSYEKTGLFLPVFSTMLRR